MGNREVNITQFLHIKDQPFRRTLLDYSHLPYADVLDAFAATILISALTALLMHLATCLCRMSTRSLSVKSLYEGSFLSDFVQLTPKVLQRKQLKHNLQWAPRLIAFILLLLLLLAEALLLLSQSSTTESYNLEDLRIRRPQLRPYAGKPFLSVMSQSCVSLIHSQYPIWFSPLDFCVTHAFTERYVPRKEEVDGAMSISLNFRYEQGELSFIFLTADYGYSVDINILLHSASSLVKMNVTNMIGNPEELLTFLTTSAAQMMSCANISEMWGSSVSQQSRAFNQYVYNCGEINEEVLLIGEGLALSTLSLSGEFISASDFFQLVPVNGSTKSNPLERSGTEGYALREVIRIRGFILWIIAITLLMINFVFSFIAPDLEMARSAAVAIFLNWDSVPLPESQHVCFPLQLSSHQDLESLSEEV